MTNVVTLRPELELKQAWIIVECATSEAGPWHPVRSDEVPWWVKVPATMAVMLDGNTAQLNRQGLIYRAYLEKDVEAVHGIKSRTSPVGDVGRGQAGDPQGDRVAEGPAGEEPGP